MNDFDKQWHRILTQGPFSEEVTVTLSDGSSVVLRGILSYGYENLDQEAQYQSPKMQSYWTFKTVTSEINCDSIKGSVLTARSQSFKVLQANDNCCGELLLDLRPIKGASNADS